MSRTSISWIASVLVRGALVYALFGVIPYSGQDSMFEDGIPLAARVHAATDQVDLQADNLQTNDSGESMSDEELISSGEAVYSENCARCHQPDGQGSGGYPALAGNSFVTANDASGVIETIVEGRGSMPGFGEQLPAQEIAAVASYIRNSWENQAAVVQPQEVAMITGEAQPQQSGGDQPSDQQGSDQQGSEQEGSEQEGDQPEEGEQQEDLQAADTDQPEGESQEGQQAQDTEGQAAQGQAAQTTGGVTNTASSEGAAPIQIQIQIIVVTPEAGGQAAVPAASEAQPPTGEATPTPTSPPASGDTATEAGAAEESATEESAAQEDQAAQEGDDAEAQEASQDEQQPVDSPNAVPQIGSSATPSGTLPGEPAIQLIKVAEGLVDPINVAYAPDGSGRVFIVERIGRIMIMQNGELLEEPFLDIQEVVKIDFLEQGLLGLAFHPDYANNGRFFVNYSDTFRNGATFIVEYQVSDDNPNVANPDSAKVLVTYDQPYRNHNGGKVAFGPDGYLYWASGDGGLAGDSLRNAQSLETMLGKLLRIDVDVDASNRAGYTIPEDNPFMGQFITSAEANSEAQDGDYIPNALPEIWAYGLRNPWQFSFDRETGDLYIADVGQAGWEEINFQAAGSEGGVNYGWPIMEASHCFPADKDCGLLGELPVAEYANPDDGCSITGVGIYRGDQFPTLDGIYFATDYCTGRFWGLMQGEGDEWHFAELLSTSLVVTGAGEDEAGNLYVTTCTCQFGRDYNPYEESNGMIWQIVSQDQVPEGAETAPLRE